MNKQRILGYIERNNTREPERIRLALKKYGVPMAEIRATLAEINGEPQPAAKAQPAQATANKPTVRGIVLANLRVSDRKPQEGLKAQLYSLKRDRAYPLTELADDWCVSVETLRMHAKRLDCLKYVETQPGQWVMCALHPDTAASL
jgi:hypothetical protein